MRTAVAAVLVTTALAAPGVAAERVPAVLQKLADCRAIADSAARLACYDAAAAGIADATRKQDIVVLDREAVRETRRGLFGFALPKLPFFGGGDDDRDKREVKRDEVVEIDAVVASARAFGYGQWKLTMEDGAIWVTTEPFVLGDPHAGDRVHIKRAALGSYFLKLGTQKSVRARREG